MLELLATLQSTAGGLNQQNQNQASNKQQWADPSVVAEAQQRNNTSSGGAPAAIAGNSVDATDEREKSTSQQVGSSETAQQ